MKHILYLSLLYIVTIFSFAALQGYGWLIVIPTFMYTVKTLREY